MTRRMLSGILIEEGMLAKIILMREVIVVEEGVAVPCD
jgi:hypothetical protein